MEKNALNNLNELILSLNAEKEGVRLFLDREQNEYAMIRFNESAAPYVVDRVEVYKNQNQEWTNVGFFNFTAKPANYMFLWNIEITDESVLNCGVGSRMFNYLQEIALQSRCKTIEGNYYPKGKQDPEKTKQFYLRNGCSIDKEGYSTVIYKYIQFEKTLPTKQNEDGFLCYPAYDKDLNNNVTKNKETERSL